jgi:hypothetical protein
MYQSFQPSRILKISPCSRAQRAGFGDVDRGLVGARFRGEEGLWDQARWYRVLVGETRWVLGRG